MTAIINMASISSWNSKIPANRRLSDDKDSGGISSWSRRESEKHSDGLSMNGGGVYNIDNSESYSNNQDFNNSNNNSSMNGNAEMRQDDRLVDKHNLVSVSENPFFKSYGKIRTFHSRNEYSRGERDRIHSDSSPLSPKVMLSKENDSVFNNSVQDDEEEEEVEYHPGSGFVTKLLGKFKKYEHQEQLRYTPVPMKRSASLENVLDDRPDSVGTGIRKGVRNENVASVIGQTNLNYRTKSVEHISNSKPVPGKRAPDEKLGRKNIVIIESNTKNTVPPSNGGHVSPARSPVTRSGSMSPTITTASLREEKTETDELPKPNTVTNARNIFESSKSGGKSRTRAPPPLRPSHPPGTKISAVAPTKNLSVSTNLHRDRPTSAELRKVNNAQKPNDVVMKTTVHSEVPSPRSTLPPITNRSKKPSPVVTVAPYKPRPEESSPTPATVPLPQKPVITPRHIDKKPSPPKIQANYVPVKEVKEDKITKQTKSDKIIENNRKFEIKQEKENVKSFPEEIISKPVTRNEFDVSDSIKSKNFETVESVSIVSDSRTEDLSLSSEPIKGIPTIIAQRMKKENGDPSRQNSSHNPPSDTNYSGNTNIVQNDIVSSKKRQAPGIPVNSDTSENSEQNQNVPESNSELTQRKNLHHNAQSKDIGGPAKVFDSSMIAKKKRKPNYSNNTGVPKLDLTGINDSRTQHGYQEGYKPTEIKPCKIIFIGALVDTGRSVLKKEKSNSSKGRIKFNDQASTLHEYPSELYMLEEYLLKHPEEEELVMLESFSNDIESTTDEDDGASTPRHNTEDDVLKSNTSLSHSGGLSSYVSKYQPEFDWNNHREPDPIVIRLEPEQEQTQTDEVGIIPASEDDTNAWSESTTSDLLF